MDERLQRNNVERLRNLAAQRIWPEDAAPDLLWPPTSLD
jgi:hypothetical protein